MMLQNHILAIAQLGARPLFIAGSVLDWLYPTRDPGFGVDWYVIKNMVRRMYCGAQYVKWGQKHDTSSARIGTSSFHFVAVMTR